MDARFSNQRLDQRPIADLELGAYTHKLLTNIGVRSLGQLVQRSESDLLKSKGFNLYHIDKITSRLAAVGLKLKAGGGSVSAGNRASNVVGPPSKARAGDLKEEIIRSLRRSQPKIASELAREVEVDQKEITTLLDRYEGGLFRKDDRKRWYVKPEASGEKVAGTPLKELGLEYGVLMLLAARWIDSIEELAEYSEGDLLKFRGVQLVTIEKIKVRLGAFSLKLKGEGDARVAGRQELAVLDSYPEENLGQKVPSEISLAKPEGKAVRKEARDGGPLGELGLTRITEDYLSGCSVQDVGELVLCSEKYLESQGIPAVRVKEISQKLANKGLKLKAAEKEGSSVGQGVAGAEGPAKVALKEGEETRATQPLDDLAHKLSQPLGILNLSSQADRHLADAKINTVGELVNWKEQDLVPIIVLDEIKVSLVRHGLSFTQEKSPVVGSAKAVPSGKNKKFAGLIHKRKGGYLWKADFLLFMDKHLNSGEFNYDSLRVLLADFTEENPKYSHLEHKETKVLQVLSAEGNLVNIGDGQYRVLQNEESGPSSGDEENAGRERKAFERAAPKKTQKRKANKAYLNQTFVSALGDAVSSTSDQDVVPLEVVVKIPYEVKLRVYLFSARSHDKGVRAGKTDATLKVPGQKAGREDFDYSGDQQILLVGYEKEEGVFILWNAETYSNFPVRQIQVDRVGVLLASAYGLYEQKMNRNSPVSQEVVVCSTADKLHQAIDRRLELTRDRLLDP